MLILFVCYGNSCRSPMAESIFNTLNKNKDNRAISAGTNPADIVQPETYAVLKEKGFIVDGLTPDLVTSELMERSDMVIPLDDWVGDKLKTQNKEVWDIPDPYQEPIESYKRTRDILEGKILELLDKLG